MLKRGQLSIFMIVGVILIAVVGLSYMLKNSSDINPDIKSYSDIQLVQLEIENCLQFETERYLKLFGLEGGALILRFDTESIEIPVRTYYEYGTIAVPEKNQLETDFSNVMKNVAPYCLVSENQAFDIIEVEEAKVTTTFSERSTIVDYHYPIEIRSKTKEEKLQVKQFQSTFPIQFESYLRAAKEIITAVDKRPDFIDVGAVDEYPFDISIQPQSENYIIYSIIDRYDNGPEDTFVFQFATLFNDTENVQPFFVNIQEQYELSVGENFEEDLNAVDIDGDQVFYSIITDNKAITINKITGLLSFSPDINDIGNHSVEIFVDDGKGLWEEREVLIIVT